MPKGKFFAIESVGERGCLLEVRDVDINGQTETHVVTVRTNGTELYPEIHQVWWFDRATYSIRARANDFCIDVKGGQMVVAPFHSLKADQRWGISPDGDTIQSRNGKRVLGLLETDKHPGGRVFPMEDEDGTRSRWMFKYIPPQLMCIRNSLTHKVLDIKGSSGWTEGTQVILYNEWVLCAENQLWYEDENGIIRAKLQDFALTAEGDIMTVRTYNPSQKNQQWIINNRAIQNRCDPDLVLDFRGERSGLFARLQVLCATAYNGGEQQCWEYDYLPNQEETFGDHLGKSSLIRHLDSGLYLTAVALDSVGIPSTRTDLFLQERSVHTPDSQLWTIDEQAKVIRLANSENCIDLIGDQAVLGPHQKESPNQYWQFKDMTIQNVSQPSVTLQPEKEVLQHGTGFNHVVAQHQQDKPHLWQAERVLARYFFIRSAHCQRVLDIKAGNRAGGADVIIFDRKDEGTGTDNQLWFEGFDGVVRSKLNGFAFDCTEKTIKMRPYHPRNANQQWVIFGDTIKNRGRTDLVLDIYGQRDQNGTSVIAYSFHGATNQRWHFDYI